MSTPGTPQSIPSGSADRALWHLELHYVAKAGPRGGAWRAEAVGPSARHRFDSIAALSRWLAQLDESPPDAPRGGPGIR